MSWIVANMKWIMVVSGGLTCTMLYAAIAPQEALHSTFGESIEGPVAEIVVRNWGGLITLIGAMLIYGAYHAQGRPMILTVAALSKLVFIGLTLTYGSQFLGQQVSVAIAIDSLMVILFVCYLLSVRGRTVVS